MDYRGNFRVVKRTSSLEIHEINCTRCKCSEPVQNLVSRRFRLIPGLQATVCNTMGMHHDHRSDKRALCSLLNYNETCISCLFDLINCGAKMAGLDLVHTDLDIFEIAIYYVT